MASAILRTITEVLETKARMGEPVQPRQAVQEVEELDIHNVFKLENIDGNDENESSCQENSDQEIDEKNFKKFSVLTMWFTSSSVRGLPINSEYLYTFK